MTDYKSLVEIKEMLEAVFNNSSEHPGYPLSEWRQEVASDNTRQGYWDWVAEALQQAD